jgi:hypothetical protein
MMSKKIIDMPVGSKKYFWLTLGYYPPNTGCTSAAGQN